MKACTLCLQTNVNMCQLGNSAAIDFIQDIFVKNGFHKLSKHNYICFICHYLLNKSYNFIQKTLRAQKALKDIIEEGTKITVATLLQIDRDKLNLDINLICQPTEANYQIWGANRNDQLQTKENTLENNIDCFVKTETCGPETFENPLDCLYRNNNYNDDTNYDNDNNENGISNIKEETVTEEIDVKVDLDQYLNDRPSSNTRRLTNVNYKEIDDYNVKSRTKKFKRIKSKPKDEYAVDGYVKPGTKRKRGSKPKAKKKKKWIDTRKYPMKCDHCKYVVQNKTEHFHHYLLYHQGIKYPYGKPAKYICQHCGAAKSSSHVLRQHELTHGEKKVKCQQCGKLFHNNTRLKRHVKRHGAVLKICDYCNKGFVAREDLILHIRTHTGVKPFKCVLCGAAFAHRGNVAIHMRSRHQQQATPTTQAPPTARATPRTRRGERYVTPVAEDAQ